MVDDDPARAEEEEEEEEEDNDDDICPSILRVPRGDGGIVAEVDPR